MKTLVLKQMYDKFGIWLSSLCALHCLLLPILIPLIPIVASSMLAEAWFERTILVLSVAVGFVALMTGFYRYHRQLYPVYLLALGAFIYWHKDIFGHEFEPLTISVGAGLIIVSHVINIKLCKSCTSCDEDSGCSTN